MTDERLERLQMMVGEGSPQVWDLSANDMAAIQFALDRMTELESQVRDLTVEREDRKAAYSKLVEYFGDRVSTDEFASLSSLVGLAVEDMTGLRDNVERLANDKHEALLAKAEAEEKAAIINSELFDAKKEISKAEALYNHLFERTMMLKRQLAGMRGA